MTTEYVLDAWAVIAYIQKEEPAACKRRCTRHTAGYKAGYPRP